MARHAAYGDDRPLARPGLGLLGRLGLIAFGLILVIGAAVVLIPPQAWSRLPWATPAQCTPDAVDIVVSPELLTSVATIVTPLRDRRLADGHCLEPEVRGQEPQETVVSAGLLPVDRAPQIWIPNGTVWGQEIQHWSVRTVGSLGYTPVVLATSARSAESLGWNRKRPTWYQAMRGHRAVAVQDYLSQSESLDSLIALWQSLGKGNRADQEVVATVLAADHEHAPDPAAALTQALAGSAHAPLFPATEQTVADLNTTSLTGPQLTAIYPLEGSPVLDYPVYQVTGTDSTRTGLAATRQVIAGLVSPAAQKVMRNSGFRTATGGNPVGAGISNRHVRVLVPPSRTEVDGMVAKVNALGRPSRILTVVDVSLSMNAQLNDGVTRIDMAGAALRSGVNLLPDTGSVGLWVFASRMNGTDRDYRVLAPVRMLGSRTPSGETQRTLLTRLAENSGSDLSGGGTSLYDVAIAAIRSMHDSYDPKAANAVILMSDGANQDSTGATLKDVLDEIHRLNRGSHKVAIYTGGLGPDADYAALHAIAAASGGYMYRIDDALGGQQALLDGLRRNRKLGD